MLGYFYNYGIGTSIDEQKAVELYQKAASLGNSVAQHNLANMYAYGVWIEKDIDQAIYYWYEQSAKQGYQDAEKKLKRLKAKEKKDCKIVWELSVILSNF